MEEGFQNEPTVGTLEKVTLIEDPPFDYVQPTNEQSSLSTKSFLQSRKPKDGTAISTKVKRRSRLKCSVCSKGFEMKKDLARHKKTHVSGALAERYVESRNLEAPGSSAKRCSGRSVQRYLTLNMAMAIKLREIADDKRKKVQNRISKSLRINLSSDRYNLKQMKQKTKLARLPKHDNLLRVLPSHIQDRTQNFHTNERKVLSVAPPIGEGAGPSQPLRIGPIRSKDRTLDVASERISFSAAPSIDEGAGPLQPVRFEPIRSKDRTLDVVSERISFSAAPSIDEGAGPLQPVRIIPIHSQDMAQDVTRERIGLSVASPIDKGAGLSQPMRVVACQIQDRTTNLTRVRIPGSAAPSIDVGAGPSQPVQEVNRAWSILDTETLQPSKFNIRAEPETPVCTSAAGEDLQFLGRSIKLEKQTEPFDTLNQISAMRTGVSDLFTSLKAGNNDADIVSDSHLNQKSEVLSSQSSSDELSSNYSDDEENIDGNKDSIQEFGNKTKALPNWDGSSQLSTNVKRMGSRRSTFCEICQKDFQKLKRHLIVHYGERSHKCEVCGKAFYEARILEKHRTTHTKQHKCSVCGESFSKLRAARRHAKIHLPARPYSCEICQQSFTCRSSVRKHIQALHTSVRQFVCDVCGATLRTLNSLKSHKRKHTGEKPFICEICGKSFRYSSGLHVHSFAHTTGKPYPCPKCDQYFAHNYLRKRHLLTHKTDDPPLTKKDDCGGSSTNISSADSLRFEEFPPRYPFNKDAVPGEHFMQVPGINQDANNAVISSNEERARRMKTVLGPHSFKGGHSQGIGSRWTPANSLVVTLCDGSYKALKGLKEQGVEDDDLPSHYGKDCAYP